jgi:hypothetical protein
VIDKLEKEVVMAEFKVLFQQLPGRIEENHEAGIRAEI